MNTMKAARLHAVGDFRTDTVSIPQPQGDELLIKVGACGVCGSDIPRIFSHGTSNQKYPLVLGHEFAGNVIAVGETADQGLIGQRGAVFPLIPCKSCDMCQIGKYVMCSDYDYLGSRRDGGFAEYVVIPSGWNFVPSENSQTPMEALAMTEPACVAQHALRQGKLAAGEKIIIFGAGAIGILTARLAKLFGASVVMLVDIEDEKVRFAKECGFDAINSCNCDPAQAMKEHGGWGADVVIEGTGSASALEGCIAAVKPMGRIVMLGNPCRESTVISQKAHSNILRKELQMTGTWNSGFAPYPMNEWYYIVSLIDKGILRVTDIITHRASIETLPELCHQIYNRDVSVCKAICSAEG